MLAVTINRIGSGITLLEIGWRTEVFCGKELQQPQNNSQPPREDQITFFTWISSHNGDGGDSGSGNDRRG